MVPSFLVPGLGMTESRGNIDLECENLIKDTVVDVGCRLVCILKAVLLGSCLLTLGISYPQLRHIYRIKSWVPEHQEHKNKKEHIVSVCCGFD